MKRVIVINWKKQAENSIEVFSNLKLFCETHPSFNYNTLNNYLSKNKIAYENEVVRIERKVVQTEPIKKRQIVLVGNRVKTQGHDEEKQNKDYWLTRPVKERLDAVRRLRSQVIKNDRMDRNYGLKRKMK
jgi:hypothetical protein